MPGMRQRGQFRKTSRLIACEGDFPVMHLQSWSPQVPQSSPVQYNTNKDPFRTAASSLHVLEAV